MKMASFYSERKRNKVILGVLAEYIVENGKNHKVFHDNAKHFVLKILRLFLKKNVIK